MKKIIIGSSVIIVFIVILFVFFNIDNKDEELEEVIVIKYTDLNIRVFSEVYLSSLIESDITLVDDILIDTNEIGNMEINFKYVYLDNTYSSSVMVNIIDDVAPTIFASSSYTIVKGVDKDFLNIILCGDNYDDEIERKIIGEYDYNMIGSYNLVYYAEDSSGNSASRKFTVNVVEKSNSSSSSSDNYVNFSSVVEKYKTDNTKIGIDVSKWQGEIDFNKVHDAGCEFVIIRVGYQNGVDGDYIVDPYFEININNALDAGLDVGVYFYSYAKDETDAINQALWVVDKIKNYDVKLGVSYDWESWTSFNKLNLSYHHFTNVANTFLNVIKLNGYQTYLYSSKYYLENIWTNTTHATWLAHYTDKTNYKGEYHLWQLTNIGRIQGISGNVDIDILYE